MADRGWSTADSTAAYAAGAAAAGAAVQRQQNASQMAWMRQERMMELKAQEAQRQIDERYKAAQADLLMQNAAMLQKDREIEEALPMTWQQQLEATGGDHEAAIRNTLEIAAMASPRVAAKLAGTIKTMAEAQNVGKPTAHQRILEQQAQARLGMEQQQEARRLKAEARLDARENRLAAKVTLSEADRAQLEVLKKEVEALDKSRLELDPDVKGNKSKRFKLAMQAGALKKQMATLNGGRTQAAVPKVAVPEGRVLVIKDGQMGHIPLSQLEDALAEGFEQVEEGEAMQLEGDALMQEGEE